MPQPANIIQLEQALQEEWENIVNIEVRKLHTLVESMPQEWQPWCRQEEAIQGSMYSNVQ